MNPLQVFRPHFFSFGHTAVASKAVVGVFVVVNVTAAATLSSSWKNILKFGCG